MRKRASENKPNESQEGRVLAALIHAKGDWINKRYFIYTMMMTQSGRAIHNLENLPRWREKYNGLEIQHSHFIDEHKFKSYRLVPIGTPNIE